MQRKSDGTEDDTKSDEERIRKCVRADKNVCQENLENVPETSLDLLKCTHHDTPRMTGLSCQALKHAVCALNRLDDFNMEKIGSGFFSEVFKVTHRVTGKVMVLKMNLQRSNRPNMLKEVQLMNQLKHPNILKFQGVCVHEGQLHALTEYINGGSLEQLIQSRNVELPYLTRQQLALDIGRGMEYLHGKGVFHRDLTSKNVLIKKLPDDQMMAVVGDFGLAAKIPDPKCKYRLPTVGSAYWMSPECLKGEWYNEKSDIFSYGIVLCEMIARIEADPDVLPRTDNFGLDYLAFTDLCGPCPPNFLKLTFSCCTFEPSSRPSFSDIVVQLKQLIVEYEEYLRTQEVKNVGSLSNLADEISSMSTRSEEIINKCGSHLSTSTQHRKMHHRRSLSEDMSSNITVYPTHTTPSDKARCHFLTPTKHNASSQVINTKHIGETMAKVDPHYKPRLSNEKGNRPNPFLALSQFRGVKKILGSHNLLAHSKNSTSSESPTSLLQNSELFSSCFELPSPFYGTTPPSSPIGRDEMDKCHCCTCFVSGCDLSREELSSPGICCVHRGLECHHTNPHFDVTPSSNCIEPKNIHKSKTVPLIGRRVVHVNQKTDDINNVNCNSSDNNNLPKQNDEDLPCYNDSVKERDIVLSGADVKDKEVEEDVVAKDTSGCRIYSSCTNLIDCQIDEHFQITNNVQLKRRGSCESGFFSSISEDFTIYGNELLSPSEYVVRPNRHIDNSTTTLSSSSPVSSMFLLDDSSVSTTTVSSLPSGSGDLTDLDEFPSRLPHHHSFLLPSGKRSSSIYTDSSEDVSSLGGDADDRVHSRYQSQQISKIVEYFERKQLGGLDSFKARRSSNVDRSEDGKIKWEGIEGKFKKSGLSQIKDDVGDSPVSLYNVRKRFGPQHSEDSEYHHDLMRKLESNSCLTEAIRKSKIQLLRKSLERGTLQVPGINPNLSCNSGVSSTSRRPLSTRLLICEGAVKSKLPLFDKK